MIGRLAGVVQEIAEDWAILDVGGVGYVVHAPSRVLGALQPGAPATLQIETQVREDAITLYGFSRAEEKTWFRLLLTVQGVGARHALSVLSALDLETLALAVAAGDKQAIARAKGVGPKLAQRIAAELKDKAGLALGQAASPGAALRPTPAAPSPASVAAEAASALAHLGYGLSEAHAAAAAAARELGDEAPLDAIVKRALRALAPST